MNERKTPAQNLKALLLYNNEIIRLGQLETQTPEMEALRRKTQRMFLHLAMDTSDGIQRGDTWQPING